VAGAATVITAIVVHLGEVLASVLAAVVVAGVALARRLKPATELRRLAWRERRGTRRTLTHSFAPQLSRAHRRRLSHRLLRSLAESFRLQIRPGIDRIALDSASTIVGARGLLAYVRSERAAIYLVNADSGYGKTVLGMLLAMLHPRLKRHELVTFYIDLSQATVDAPLSRLEHLLNELSQARVGGFSGRPLFVLDALNEAVSPERFADELASRQARLDQLGVRLLFLFSFRHRSYPGKLRSVLRSRGFQQLERLELLFDVTEQADLTFVRAISSRVPARFKQEQLVASLQQYADAISPAPVSREIAMSYLEWRVGAPGDASSPSPAHLLFTGVICDSDRPSRAMTDLARVAFFLMSEELVTASYDEITDRVGITEAAIHACATYAERRRWARDDDRHVRFANETTVRVLAALHVASELLSATSPAALRGRTRYDVCAPYVQEALRWHQAFEPGSPAGHTQRVSDAIRQALSGTDAPYSFYATVLSNAGAEDIADVTGLDAHLFHEMVQAIDEDRGETCSDSLRAAGTRDGQPLLAPVLDQIFGVVGIYGRQAVDFLLSLMSDEAPLIRSQGAYLLHHWLGTASFKEGSRDLEAVARVPLEMNGTERNLHVRFHEVEILERLLQRLPEAMGDTRRRAAQLLAEIANCDVGTPDQHECLTVYRHCQWLVSQRARMAAAPPQPLSDDALADRVALCVSSIREDSAFESIGRGAEAEARLECWEVTLAFAIDGYRSSRRSLAFVTFAERALTHRFWIVRWWAFGNLLAMLCDAGERRESVLAARCAKRIARQLCTEVEPMGLKLRQCAVVGDILAAGDTNAGARRLLSMALRETSEESLAGPKRDEFADAYYTARGSSPDDYLWEFWRRLEEIVPVRA
jgi:hypothetical protein